MKRTFACMFTAHQAQLARTITLAAATAITGAALGACAHHAPAAGKMATTTPDAESQTVSDVIRPTAPINLFNGTDLTGWHADVPKADDNPDIAPSFEALDGLLISNGRPKGHLITNAKYRDYRLTVEYRFPREAGNCGVLVHASTPRALYGMFPQSIEVQMESGNAGDFWVIQEEIEVKNKEVRRPRKDGEEWGKSEGTARRILNLTDDSENPLGEWNNMVVDVRGDSIMVWVNGTLVNHGYGASVSSGQIALQAEGTKVIFRKVELTPLP